LTHGIFEEPYDLRERKEPLSASRDHEKPSAAGIPRDIEMANNGKNTNERFRIGAHHELAVRGTTGRGARNRSNWHSNLGSRHKA
jgi:hypothetical protein